MIECLLWVSTAVWALVLCQILLNRFLCPDLGAVVPRAGREWPRVSIVVPARDEEKAVGRAVESFCTQDYPDFEVIVVDDGSRDRTPEILDGLLERFSCLRVIEADEPSPGWLGKPNALEMGKESSDGAWLLFVDADVVFDPGLLRRAVELALSADAGMVVLGPQLETEGVLEATLMSSLVVLGLGLLPMYLVSRTRSPKLAFGAGTCNLVRRELVDRAGAFASLRDEVIDDVALGFRVKEAGGRIVVGAALDFISVRMYEGVRSAVEGFSKNAYPGLRKLGRLAVAVPFLLGFVVSFLPYLALAHGLASGEVMTASIAALAVMHAALGAVVVLYRQPAWVVVLNPVREALWWWIVVRSWLRYRRHGVVWRGRTYGIRQSRGGRQRGE